MMITKLHLRILPEYNNPRNMGIGDDNTGLFYNYMVVLPTMHQQPSTTPFLELHFFYQLP